MPATGESVIEITCLGCPWPPYQKLNRKHGIPKMVLGARPDREHDAGVARGGSAVLPAWGNDPGAMTTDSGPNTDGVYRTDRMRDDLLVPVNRCGPPVSTNS